MSNVAVPPSAASGSGPENPLPLSQYWSELPIEPRRQVLAALSRIVARSAFPQPRPGPRREVGHDRP